GRRLLLGGTGKTAQLWDVDQGKLLKDLDNEGPALSFHWSPDGSRFVRAWSAFSRNPRGFEVCDADGVRQQRYLFSEHPPFNARTHPVSIRFSGRNQVLVCCNNTRQNNGSAAVKVDLETGRAATVVEEESPEPFATVGAVSSNGQLGAIASLMGLNAIVFRLSDGTVVSRCGTMSPLPSVVGWSAAGRPAGFAWSEDPKNGRMNTRPADLQVGFDLESMEPVAEVLPDNYQVFRLNDGNWSLRTEERETKLLDGEKEAYKINVSGSSVTALSLIPRGDQPPLLTWANRKLLETEGSLVLSTSDGAHVTRLKPSMVYVRDVAPSPNGRYVVASTGTHRLCVFPTSGSQYPILSVARVKGEWAAWTADGYYSASPGGEKLIGWVVSNGCRNLAQFYPAERFASRFRRPDILRKAIQMGSVEQAVTAFESNSPEPKIEQLLPPVATLRLVRQTGAAVTVQATATVNISDMPVLAMRLLLDGRPLSNGQCSTSVDSGLPADATWELNIPPGVHELKLLARSAAGSAVSDPLPVRAPKSAGQQPVLHRLCVGVNDYDQPALRLAAATGDAQDMFGALETYCVGSDNRFGSARGSLLVDREATRAAVLSALAEIRKNAKPGDLVVMTFAGHGVKQRDEYYLLMRDSDPSQDLKDVALSGEDLRRTLADMECPVLLILDACHSAQSLKSLRPATDELARRLTDESAGVTVMAAAMAHEVAAAGTENGYFTAAFLHALQLGQGVPFDPYEHALYTHHIYASVFSEVRRATGGRQNPFLNSPWTAPPLVLRDVPDPASQEGSAARTLTVPQ
ncbi:MAG: caspase family protein, partial [Planctomycetaceae bacterium]|nr:caspase family protein [Planctomycetaceae bacterium]